MAIEQKGDFILIQKTSIRISEILSARPESWATVDYSTGKIINRDFPKIIISTREGSQMFLYGIGEDYKRDEDLRHLNEIIGSYQVKKEGSQGSTTINVTGSSGVNIISNSSNVTIDQKNINEAKGILTEMKQELDKQANINKELKEDILAVIGEVESQIVNDKQIKRHSFRSLLGITSDFASLSGLAISLGQILGYL